MKSPKYTRYSGGSSMTMTRPDERRNAYPNPTSNSVGDRNAFYAQAFSYYANTAFEDVAMWARYRLNHNLYRHTRSIFNPVTRIVDFYAEHIYPGLLSDKSVLEDGVPSAVPFTSETPNEIRTAAAQIWEWSNWQTGNTQMVGNAAMTGNCLVEVVDDFMRGKIRFKVYYPSFVKDFRLDDYGNLKSYVIEYMSSDPNIDGGRPFRYAKEVTSAFIAFYKDGESFDYGQGRFIYNDYGFAPAVWVKHLDLGADFGVPAIASSIGKIDEVNSLVSHTSDHIHKQIESPRILWTNTEVKPLFGGKLNYDEYDGRQQQVLLKGGVGGATETLVGTLDPQTIVPIIEKMLEEIERDFPEITMYERLRKQNIVTAPGAERLMGDVKAKMSRPSANYDLGNKKLIQMGLAIGGWRANSGHWGRDLTRQQSKFLPFDLISYERSELDLGIKPRLLTPPTSREQADEMSVRANAVSAAGDNLPMREKLLMLGKRESEIPDIIKRLKSEKREAAENAAKLIRRNPGSAGNEEDKNAN